MTTSLSRLLPLAAVVALALLAFPLVAQDQAGDAETTDEQPPAEDSENDVQGQKEGYPQERGIEKPGDVEDDLNTSFPKTDSLFPDLVPKNWSNFKANLYEKHDLKLATSYQSLFMWPSEVLFGESNAGAGFFLFELKWDALRKGSDYQGGIVASIFDIHPYGDLAPPGAVFVQTGSMIVNDAVYVNVDLAISNLYWEQWFKKDRLVTRFGQYQAINLLDFFRYADVRTSFSGAALSFPAASIPYGPPGFGAAFKWFPKTDSELYVGGLVNDINSEIDELDWGPIFSTGDVFAGVEIGHNWKRLGKKGGELDHVHLTLFYADEPTRKEFPAESGWGAKLAGEKQWGKFVGFGNYAYNTSKGGGFGGTFYEHAVNLGLAYNKPFGIRGEIAGAATWAKQLDGGGCGFLDCNGDDEWGTEIYWKLLVTPDLWVTPGLQFAFNPVLNPNTDFVSVPYLKFRAFF